MVLATQFYYLVLGDIIEAEFDELYQKSDRMNRILAAKFNIQGSGPIDPPQRCWRHINRQAAHR